MAPADTANVYGADPPEAPTDWLYGTPGTGAGNVAGNTLIVPQTKVLITIVYVRAPKQPFASLAWTVKVKLPMLVGVPDTSPAALSSNPGGNDPLEMENVYDALPPLAESVCV